MTLRTSPAHDIPKMMRFYGLDRFPYVDEYDYHRIMRIYQMLREETAQSFGPPPPPFKFPPSPSLDVDQSTIKKETHDIIPVRHSIRYWGDDIELPPDHYREIYFKIPECCQVRFKKISSEFLSRNTEWVKKNYKVFPCLYMGSQVGAQVQRYEKLL